MVRLMAFVLGVFTDQLSKHFPNCALMLNRLGFTHVGKCGWSCIYLKQ